MNGDEPQEGEEQSDQPADSSESDAEAGGGGRKRAQDLLGGVVNLGMKVGGFLNPIGKLKLTLWGGVIVIDVGVVVVSLVMILAAFFYSNIGNSGTGGTAPVDGIPLGKQETLEDLQLIQCLQEEANQARTENATIGPECAQQILKAVDRMKRAIDGLRKRTPIEGDGLIVHNRLDSLEFYLEGMTSNRKLSELQALKKEVDTSLALLNADLSKVGVAGGFKHLAGKESTIKLGKIRVIRNKFVAQLLDDTGIVIGSARIGIGEGTGDGSNYLKTSGFVPGDHVTPLGNFTTGYLLRDTVKGIYSNAPGARGSYMGKEVIQYMGGVANPERGLLFHSGKLTYDQRDPLPLTWGCVRLTSTDMRTLYNIVQAQTNNKGKQKSISVEIIDQ